MKPSDVPLPKLMPIQSIQGWQDFLQDGEGYLKTAVGAHKNRKSVFTAEILYNITTMAIEKFVMAALMRHGTMPYNHTMADLVEAMEDAFPGAIADIREGLLRLDRYQEICDLETYNITPPDMEEIPAMLDLANRMHILVSSKINTCNQ